MAFLTKPPEEGTLARRLARWGRFVVGGGLNTAVTYVVYLALAYVLNYQLAFLIAYTAGVMFSYCYNAKFVFRMPMSWKGMMAYPMVYIVQYAISALALGVMVESLDLSKTIAPILVAVATLPVTYVLSKTIIRRFTGKN